MLIVELITFFVYKQALNLGTADFVQIPFLLAISKHRIWGLQILSTIKFYTMGFHPKPFDV